MRARIFLALVLLFNSYCNALPVSLNYTSVHDKIFKNNDALDNFIQRKVDNAKVPSLSAAVVRNGKVVWSKAYGFANRFSNPKLVAVSTETPYLLASVSKTVMAVTLMHLYDRNLFKLDDDINMYLQQDTSANFVVRNPSFPDAPITFRQLLTHTSSISDVAYNNLPDTDVYFYDQDPDISLGSFLFHLFHGKYYKNTCFLRKAPGMKYSYSNIGAALAAYMVEVLTGIEFAEYSQKHILTPLGINKSTSWRLDSLDKSLVAMPTEYRAQGWKKYGLYTFADYPSGGLFSTAYDTATFLGAFMADGKSATGVQILRESTVKEMRRPQQQHIPALRNRHKQGLVWFYEKVSKNSRRVLGHDGSEMGSSTSMFYDPATNVGVVMLSNGDDKPSSNKAFKKIQKRLLKEFV